MTTATLTPVDIIQLLKEATLLSDEQKQVLLDRLARGENSPELKQELQDVFIREAEELERQANELQRLNVDAQRQQQEAQQEFEQEAPQIVEAFQEGAGQAVADFTNTAHTTERELEQFVEQHAQSGEKQEIDAIREGLKRESE